MQGALQKKPLTVSLVEQFKENHENKIFVYFAVVISMVISILHGKINITWQYDFLLSYRQHCKNVDS